MSTDSLAATANGMKSQVYGMFAFEDEDGKPVTLKRTEPPAPHPIASASSSSEKSSPIIPKSRSGERVDDTFHKPHDVIGRILDSLRGQNKVLSDLVIEQQKKIDDQASELTNLRLRIEKMQRTLDESEAPQFFDPNNLMSTSGK